MLKHPKKGTGTLTYHACGGGSGGAKVVSSHGYCASKKYGGAHGMGAGCDYTTPPVLKKKLKKKGK